MTRRELIAELMARRPAMGQREAEAAIKAVFDALAEGMAADERIEIRGFGALGLKPRAARLGRNPKTGAVVQVEAKRVPFFRAAKELRSEINRHLT